MSADTNERQVRLARQVIMLGAIPSLLLGSCLTVIGGIGTVIVLLQDPSPHPSFVDLGVLALTFVLMFVVLGVLLLALLGLSRVRHPMVSAIGAGVNLAVGLPATILSIIEGPVLALGGMSFLAAGLSALISWRLRGKSLRWVVGWGVGAGVAGPLLLAAAVPLGMWLSLPPTLEGHTRDVRSVAWSPNGRRLASGAEDGTIMVWDAETGEQILTLESHTASVHSLAWSPDGERIASGSRDKTIIIWDARTGEQQRSLAGHSAAVHNVAWSPDGERIASGSRDGRIVIWDAVAGGPPGILASTVFKVNDVAWSTDGTQLASASEDRSVTVWDTETGEQRRTFEGHTGEVYSVAWSPDETQLASTSEDDSVIVWDAETGEKIFTLKTRYGAVVTDASWSPDGRTLACVTLNAMVTAWNAETGKELRSLNYHTHGAYPADFVPNNAAWSPDGEAIAWGSQEVVVLWERPLAFRPFCLLTNRC